MVSQVVRGRLGWTVAVPLAAFAGLVVTWGRKPGDLVLALVAVLLIGAVLAAVHHAEVVAHRVGEPFGSLVLAVAVTIIEVALIVTLMVSGGGDTAGLARDTVFAAVMITVNGIVGLSPGRGRAAQPPAALQPRGHRVRAGDGDRAGDADPGAPPLHDLRPPARSSPPASSPSPPSPRCRCTCMFVFTQTVRHRDFFLPVDEGGAPPTRTTTATPTRRRAARR